MTDDPEVTEEGGGIDPAEFLRRTNRWSLGLGAAGTVTGAALGGLPLAAGVACGSVFGWVNLWLLARALKKTIARADEHRGRSKLVPPAALLLKWPGLLLALAVVLLYAPIAPEGVAIGAVLSLAAASIAAVRSRKPAASHAEPHIDGDQAES